MRLDGIYRQGRRSYKRPPRPGAAKNRVSGGRRWYFGGWRFPNEAGEPRAAMIISASYRTDIPAFYGAWFANRLTAGFCRVANPYGGAPYRVPLGGPELDGFVFWTRNAAPFAAALDAVAARRVPFVVHYTVTGYPRALEAATPPAARAVAAMHELRDRFAPRPPV